MSLTSLGASGSRPAKLGAAAAGQSPPPRRLLVPGFTGGWRRRRQDASPSALGRTLMYCPSRFGLAPLASDTPGT
jgi:hypothetical protein